MDKKRKKKLKQKIKTIFVIKHIYRQRVYGVATALVKIGYEYTDCKDIMWDVQTTKLSGNDMSISEVGGWNLDIHHRYNFHEG